MSNYQKKNKHNKQVHLGFFFFLVQVQSTKIHKLSPTFSFYNGILCSFLLFQVEITQKWLVLSWKISVSLSVAFKKEKKDRSVFSLHNVLKCSILASCGFWPFFFGAKSHLFLIQLAAG